MRPVGEQVRGAHDKMMLQSCLEYGKLLTGASQPERTAVVYNLTGARVVDRGPVISLRSFSAAFG